MKRFSPEVEADIRKRSNVFGLVLGILCLPFALIGGSLGACCPLGSFIGVAPVIFAGLFSGALAAMFLDWGRIQSDEAMQVGVKVGLRSSLLASLIGAGATFLASLASSTSWLALGKFGAELGAPGSVGVGTAGFGGALISNLLVLIFSVIPGVLLGTLGGVIGAAIKRPAVGPSNPASPPSV